MKTRKLFLPVLLILLTAGCDLTQQAPELQVSDLDYSGCNTGKKSDEYIPAVRLTGQPDGRLLIEMSNTESSCGTETFSTKISASGTSVCVELIDNGPYTRCNCPHDLQFTLGPLEDKDYELTLIESENAYSRDTFVLCFSYSPDLDTLITGISPDYLLSSTPLHPARVEAGGCNAMVKSARDYPDEGPDTLQFFEAEDTLRVFVGLNLTCCQVFDAGSYIAGDTLIMEIIRLNDEACDCMCYYTFDYIFGDYTGQGFYYRFILDDQILFKGSCNLPDPARSFTPE
ncbi:MAG: hypothetical protein ACOYXB_16940 [Bacteroidota bacterium]